VVSVFVPLASRLNSVRKLNDPLVGSSQTSRSTAPVGGQPLSLGSLLNASIPGSTDALRTYVRNPTAAMCPLALVLALLPHDLYVVLVPAALLPVLLWLPARGAGSRSDNAGAALPRLAAGPDGDCRRLRPHRDGPHSGVLATAGATADRAAVLWEDLTEARTADILGVSAP
jgi:hypothetical protein